MRDACPRECVSATGVRGPGWAPGTLPDQGEKVGGEERWCPWPEEGPGTRGEERMKRDRRGCSRGCSRGCGRGGRYRESRGPEGELRDSVRGRRSPTGLPLSPGRAPRPGPPACGAAVLAGKEGWKVGEPALIVKAAD